MHAQSHHGHTRSRETGWEYGLYFVLILAISLPTALIRMVLPKRGHGRKFFVTEAWAMARDVTPRIFSA